MKKKAVCVAAVTEGLQRTIESITGRQTVLFRAPYDTDSSPTLSQQLYPLQTVSDLGYWIASADVDSEDYLQPGVAKIEQNVVDGLRKTGANVVVMHDAGGDRSQTVEALRHLIPRLKSEGYRFAALNELLGVDFESTMPRISRVESAILTGSHALLWLRTWGWRAISCLFLLTTVVAIFRIAALGFLVARSKRPPVNPDFTPPVLVLIPAYNESKVIRRTLECLVRCDYPDLRMLVVDDGSTDNTARIVECMAREHPEIRLRTKPNGGKWSALNLGFREATEDYIVTIDADTLIGRDTIRHLIAPFGADSRVDAVCGNVQVGNINNVLTAFQDLEYVTSQNFDRDAFSSINAISVVPGATGAWRREAVLAAGGYSNQTLTEDADLTLTMLTRGARIVYARKARSVTEAPERMGPLYKQRFRWSFGTFQCLWKHRASFFHNAMGWVALPNMLVFQLLFPVLSPVGDCVLILALIRGDFNACAAGYAIFLAMDLMGSLVAFVRDERSMRYFWVIAFQRFYYRQFMYIVSFASVLAALRGGRHGWNKLERKGSVMPIPMRSRPVLAGVENKGTVAMSGEPLAQIR